jgi:hypothetical protein
MTLSNTGAAQLALIPGVAETAKRYADAYANVAWSGLILKVIYLRNSMYVTGALTAALTRQGIRTSSRKVQAICAGSASLCSLGCIAAGKGLYDTTKFIQGIVNGKDRT